MRGNLDMAMTGVYWQARSTRQSINPSALKTIRDHIFLLHPVSF